MEIKILNFVEAMNVVEILSKYEKPNLDKPILDYIDNLLSNISPPEYLQLLKLLTGKEDSDLLELGGTKLLEIFSLGLQHNNIIDIFKAHSKMVGLDNAG